MKLVTKLVVPLSLIASAIAFANEGDIATKDGKLAHTLRITQLQGGFAGFTGMEFTVEPDGSWSTAAVFNKKTTPKGKGKLSAKELETLVSLLAKNEVDKLPAKAGKQPGANPHTIAIEFGKTRASLVGQTPPKVDPNNPASVEGRFAAIYQGVTRLLKDAGK